MLRIAAGEIEVAAEHQLKDYPELLPSASAVEPPRALLEDVLAAAQQEDEK
jgi:hypothetical protein